MSLFEISRIQSGWKTVLLPVLKSEKSAQLADFLEGRVKTNIEIFPQKAQWFRALEDISPEDVKVVILGQDPYHGPGQAHGLAFSVPEGVALPPSLRNIFKEISAEYDRNNDFKNGCLDFWAEQGVLLLNPVLTVERGAAGAHRGQGWEEITDELIKCVSRVNQAAVFMLWGSQAHLKESAIDTKKHLVLKSVHPSPLSAYRGFFGCGHFKKANNWLKSKGKGIIKWY